MPAAVTPIKSGRTGEPRVAGAVVEASLGRRRLAAASRSSPWEAAWCQRPAPMASRGPCRALRTDTGFYRR